VHRLSGEVTEAFGSIAKELGGIASRQKDERVIHEGLMVRLARLDDEHEVTRDDLRKVRDEANGWRTSAEDSQHRAIVASKEVAEATIKRAELAERLRVSRESHHEIPEEGSIVVPASFLKSKNAKLALKVIGVLGSMVLTYLATKLGIAP
jgi:hypothetical protein